MFRFGLCAWCYAALYLGVGRLCVMASRDRIPSGVVFSFLLQIVLVTFGTLIPVVAQLSLVGARDFDYTILQISNPFWTLGMIVQGRVLVKTPSGFGSMLLNDAVTIILSALGIGMFLLHFVLALSEVEKTRLDAPKRVRDEDLAVLVAKTPVKRKNPWETLPS